MFVVVFWYECEVQFRDMQFESISQLLPSGRLDPFRVSEHTVSETQTPSRQQLVEQGASFSVMGHLAPSCAFACEEHLADASQNYDLHCWF